MSNIISYILCFGWLFPFLMGLLGLLLGWLLFRGRKIEGDLSIEGEGALRAEADGLRARVKELEGRVSTKDTEVSGLKSKLAAAAAGAGAAAVATKVADSGDDDEAYALEWRNRYLAARVKYLEGRLSEEPKAKAAPKKRRVAKKTAAPKAKAAAKKAAPKKKTVAKKSSAPKVLYTDGPTDGPKDDLKLISGIGPKFEKDLNGKGIYYFRQIANWKKKDVDMVDNLIDSFPGRIQRDEWVKQAQGLSKTSTNKKAASKAASTRKTRKKPGPKPGTKRGRLTAAGTVRKKPGPKPGSKRKKPTVELTDVDKYYANVKKYHKTAKKGTVENIVKYCGVALRSRDSSLVACSDEAEKDRVAKGFVTKKLGLTTGQGQLVSDICQEMKGERFKNRVTFYYLAAKKAKKLDVFEK